MLVAIGAAALIDLLRGRARAFGATAGAVALIASAGWSVADYFGRYVIDPGMFWEYDSGITQVARYIASRPAAGIYLTPYDRFYEVVAVTLAEARRAPIQSYNGMACAVFPEVTQGETEWVVVTEKDDRTLPLMQQLFPAGQVVWSLDSPAGSYARALRVPPHQTARLTLEYRAQADLGGRVKLAGYDLPASAREGEVVRVHLALKNIAPLEQAHKVFVHVRGAGNTLIAQADRMLCDFTLNHADWRPGDIVLEAYDIQIPPDAPPGAYRVVLGMYRPDTGARLPVRASDLPHEPDGIELGSLDIQR
jgi:hypothetical protein